jgi:GNAT superfamily N-acetyltransferase
MTSAQIIPALASERDSAAIVSDLHAAFMEDPVVCWAFPDRARRRRHGKHFFAMHARRSIPMGLGWRIDGGAALWMAPGQWRESTWDALRLSWRSLPGVRTRGPLVGGGLLALEARHPSEPHLYLPAIGVRPELQGRGLGSALLRPGLDHADAHGLPAYLESSNIRNVPLYERHGFEVVREHRLPRGPTMWLMWRSVQGAGPAR